ncbi:MAG TPA: DUF2235 domain-containing protein [Thermoanaerobaculia bacterium]
MLALLSLLSLLAAAVTTASESVSESRTRRLVLCLDGTANGPEQAADESVNYKLYKPTNVLKTFRAIQAEDKGVEQIVYYSDGVGSQIGQPTPFSGFEVFVDRFLGGVTAFGYEPRVKAAYRFLVANYRPGDQVFVFGFSRGAAEAQTLVRFIEWIGGVRPEKDVGGILEKQDEYYIPELYEGFRQSQVKPHHSHSDPGKAQEVFDTIRNRRCDPFLRDPELSRCKQRAIHDPVPARLEFLGVYETVVSVGSRLAPDGSVTTVAEKYAYLVDKIPPKIVRTIRQALSVDERRWDFRPQVWQPDDQSLAESGALVQRWFPGVHSNVGGGYRYDDLADHALAWMLDKQTMRARLGFNRDYLGNFFGRPKPTCTDPSRPNSDNALYKFAELIRFKSGRGVRRLATWDEPPAGPKDVGSWKRAGLGFHESLGQLLIDDCTYRPRNLLEFLAQRRQHLEEFPESQQTQIKEIVGLSQGGKKSPKPYYHCPPPIECKPTGPAAN